MLPEEILKEIMSYLSYRSTLRLWTCCKTIRKQRIPYIRLSRVHHLLCTRVDGVAFKSPISLWNNEVWHIISNCNNLHWVDIRFCKPKGPSSVNRSWDKKRLKLFIRLDRFPPSWLRAHLPFHANVEIEVVGVWYHLGVPMPDEITGNEDVEIRREPHNPHDVNAHAVYLDGQKTGYLFKRSVAKYLAFQECCPGVTWKAKRMILRHGFIPRIILFSVIHV